MHELSKVLSLTLPILLPGLTLIAILKLNLFASLSIPIDFGISLKSKRIFGDNKTLRGILIMIIVSILVSQILYLGYKNGYDSFINPVFSRSPIFVGLLYSFSYIFGELINSFIKRQMNISAGRITPTKFKSLQTFFDLSDGVIVVVFTLLVFTLASVYQVLTAGLIGIFLHYCTDLFMKRLRLKH